MTPDAQPHPDRPGRADPKRDAIADWVDAQDVVARARLAERVRARSLDLRRSGLASVGRSEEAGALALFLEFAERKGMTAAEAASLLADPGAASLRAYRAVRRDPGLAAPEPPSPRSAAGRSRGAQGPQRRSAPGRRGD